jgi:hypothetical protein
MARDALIALGFGHREDAEARNSALDAIPETMYTRTALDGELNDAVGVSLERVSVDDEAVGAAGYDSDATLPIEGEYATEEEKALQSLLRAPAAEETMEVEEATPSAAAAQVAAPVVSVRVCLAWQPKKTRKTWAGAVLAKKAANKKKALLPIIKKLRMALPVGVLDNNEEATLAHGALVKGMAGSKREMRIKLLEAARQLRRASRAWARAIGTMINAL